jgi:hypothetical protein
MKGDKTSTTNYRPVALVTVFSKVRANAMDSRLSQHLHINNIMVTEQYSFVKGISTEDAAFRLTVYLNLLTKKCMLEEFSVFKQMLLIVSIIKIC